MGSNNLFGVMSYHLILMLLTREPHVLSINDLEKLECVQQETCSRMNVHSYLIYNSKKLKNDLNVHRYLNR